MEVRISFQSSGFRLVLLILDFDTCLTGSCLEAHDVKDLILSFLRNASPDSLGGLFWMLSSDTLESVVRSFEIEMAA